MEEQAKIKFIKEVWNPKASNGIGAYVALMANVEKVGEDGIRNLRNAFASAGQKDGLRVQDGVVSMTAEQLASRIEQLEEKPGMQKTLEELQKTKTHIDHRNTALAAQKNPEPAPRARA